jgi:hypothetical protein
VSMKKAGIKIMQFDFLRFYGRLCDKELKF